jgi:hypothetical protein
MMNRDFGILLKEGKGDQLNLELDPEHPEKYVMPKHLWKMCLSGKDCCLLLKENLGIN